MTAPAESTSGGMDREVAPLRSANQQQEPELKEESPVGRFCWSDNEEYYHGTYATRDEALEEGRASNEGEDPPATIWTAVAVDYVPRIDGRRIIDQLRDSAYDDVNDISETWMNSVSRDEEGALTDALTAAFVAWAEKHGHTPTFYSVDEVEEHLPEPPASGEAPNAE